MNEVAVRSQVLADWVPTTVLRQAALVGSYAALVGALAQLTIQLPFTPVPITGQTFGVLLGGMALGWRRATLGMAAYVGSGLLGLPCFAGGNGGPSAVHAPSFGYLIGFIAAAALLGRLAELGADRHPLLTLGSMFLGNAVIYAFGVIWLAIAIQVNLGTALGLGLVPFLLGDAIKALLAAGVLPGVWKLIDPSPSARTTAADQGRENPH